MIKCKNRLSTKKTDMVNYNALIQRDLQHIWHPCSHMKDFEKSPPLVVEHAKGSYLYTNQGPMIDAISSWWCKSLGHGHPAVIEAIKNQLDRFEHVIGANTTHPQLVELGEQLSKLSKKQHVFFASDGSSAVEIALKLAIHANQLKGQHQRNQLIALSHAYHGETLGTLSISDLGIYKEPFAQFGLPCYFLHDVPYVNNKNDPLWFNCKQSWLSIERQLEPFKNTACAIIVEPIVQGAGGMLCYSADFLKRLATFAKQNDIYLIADEIMTGLGRTGQWLACDHAEIQADMICLSKGLTSGSMPLSCVLIDKEIYQLFYHDAEQGKSFLHSHTYSNNPLAISAALATLKIMQAENTNQKAQQLGLEMSKLFNDIASQTGKLTHVRSIGAIVAADLVESEKSRIGHVIAQEAQKRGALLRPMGKTLYWLPPLTTDHETMEKLAEITLHSIISAYEY